VFTARYALSPYIKQICFVFKGLIWKTAFRAPLKQPKLHFLIYITAIFFFFWHYIPFQNFPPLFSILRLRSSVPYVDVLQITLGRLRCFHPVSNFRSFSTEHFFMGWGCQPHTQPPTWRTRVSLFVWVITSDLSGMGCSISSYGNASIALRIVWPPLPYPGLKVDVRWWRLLFYAHEKR
jgi:hypothetical protein